MNNFDNLIKSAEYYLDEVEANISNNKPGRELQKIVMAQHYLRQAIKEALEPTDKPSIKVIEH